VPEAELQHPLRAECRHFERLQRVFPVVVGAGDPGRLDHVVHRLIELERLDDVVREKSEAIELGQLAARRSARDEVVADDHPAGRREPGFI
jgi:hypothetical protein